MTAVGPVHATLVLIIPLCQIMKIRDGKTTIPKLIFPRLSAYPFLFQIVNRELNVRTGLLDLSDVAGRYLIAVGCGRIEIVSILIGSHYAGWYVIKIDNRIGRTYRAGLNRTFFIRSKEVIVRRTSCEHCGGHCYNGHCQESKILFHNLIIKS